MNADHCHAEPFQVILDHPQSGYYILDTLHSFDHSSKTLRHEIVQLRLREVTIANPALDLHFEMTSSRSKPTLPRSFTAAIPTHRTAFFEEEVLLELEEESEE